MAATLHVLGLRNAPQLEGLVHVPRDGFLDFVHLVLSVQKASCNRIIHECFALTLKLSDLLVGKLPTHLLFLLKVLSLLAEIIIIGPDFFIFHEVVETLTDSLEFRLVDYCLTQLDRFPEDRIFVGHGIACWYVKAAAAAATLQSLNRAQAKKKFNSGNVAGTI
jgi:hypothetical protein